MADIPGLIEGAANGIGLGHEFLRHVERTRLLIHLLDGSGGLEGRDPFVDFGAINEELAAYSPELASKPQIVAINKMDLPETRDNLPRLTEALTGEGYEVHAISAVTGDGVPELLRRTLELLQDIPESRQLVPQERRVYTMEARPEDFWEVDRLSRHHFEVRGPKIERLTKMTDFGNEEAADRFQRVLEASGISAELETRGISAGDTVHIAGAEMIWDEAAVMADKLEASRPKRRTKRERLMGRSGIEPEETDEE